MQCKLLAKDLVNSFESAMVNPPVRSNHATTPHNWRVYSAQLYTRKKVVRSKGSELNTVHATSMGTHGTCPVCISAEVVLQCTDPRFSCDGLFVPGVYESSCREIQHNWHTKDNFLRRSSKGSTSSPKEGPCCSQGANRQGAEAEQVAHRELGSM